MRGFIFFSIIPMLAAISLYDPHIQNIKTQGRGSSQTNATDIVQISLLIEIAAPAQDCKNLLVLSRQWRSVIPRNPYALYSLIPIKGQ